MCVVSPKASSRFLEGKISNPSYRAKNWSTISSDRNLVVSEKEDTLPTPALRILWKESTSLNRWPLTNPQSLSARNTSPGNVIGNGLRENSIREVGRSSISSIKEKYGYQDKQVSEAWRLYSDRADKEWSLTDCMSFVVMNRNGISEAFTNDRHFEQAGFNILLKQ